MRNRLYEYFTDGIETGCLGLVGMEVETIFVDKRTRGPMGSAASQAFFRQLRERRGWRIGSSYRANAERRISSLIDRRGNRISLEIAPCNIEVAAAPQPFEHAVRCLRSILEILYETARSLPDEGAEGNTALQPRVYRPFRGPILRTSEPLVFPTNKREATFVALDGDRATNLMGGTAAVQFTFDVPPKKAIECLNNLADALPFFLRDYPQDARWREYIRLSHAGYRPDRYGGPLHFSSLLDYCEHLAKHRVIVGSRLLPHEEAPNADIHQFIKSVWWYFRLKRYGNRLCIEVRPLARRSDRSLDRQLEQVQRIIGL